MGLLSDILKAISNSKVNILAVNTKTGKDRIAIIYITLETKSINELNVIIKDIKKVDSIYDVRRKNFK